MLLQLEMLRDAIHRGYYMLDTYRYQSPEKCQTKDQILSCSWSVSKNFAKSHCLFGRNAQILEQLQDSLDRLSSMIVDVDELCMFWTSYPRLYHQPYSMHILLSNYMFGRQMEAELVVNFLIQQPHGAEEPEVLPIVGPGRVGKSTLVAHVCKDERVRGHFSEILFLHDHDFTDDDFTLGEGSAREHKNCLSSSNRDGRLLVVVELVGDVDEDTWDRFYYASKQCMLSGSKIIIISRSCRIAKFGTRTTLTLKILSHEAYWYFFKTLTFGSVDPETHPRLVHLAMEIARTLNGTMIGANVTAQLLRNNFDIRFWSKVLTFLRGYVQKHVSKIGEHSSDVLRDHRSTYLGRMGTSYEEIMIYQQYKRTPQEKVPLIMFDDVMYGSIRPHGKFEALLWKSRIPPYYNYVHGCEIRKLETTAVKRKRSAKNGVV
ncbi:hypothetical protein PR202_gb12013 [Eleusine coracana subsp. coracana]|uniref:NB-ARC domain-containing protein n=1 Tax=Eleusine coracana subsp. coracana TaxID=191504 RepID=A0AAV5EPX3_ELECO|nr:hypothetical protein PR202_gb12013 [Eleusine coracana subsp. coracana]